MSTQTTSRNFSTWWICGLLLCASTINYMDRQTLSNVSVRITNEFHLSDEQYGYLETAFGLAFATGAMIFGIIADRTNVRWLYPIGYSSAFQLDQAFRAARTRCGVNGALRRRTPVASKMALLIAAVIGTIEGSPPPRGCISGRLISTISTSGI